MLGKISTISRLDTSSRHQIEAEQVIVDVSSVLKELIENSIDAKSTNIEIQLVNYGIEKLIVSDDGEGISISNLKNLASSRYATSKIETDSDLESSENYGFRGEALHSIVKLSEKVTVTTADDDSGVGYCKHFSEFGSKCEIVSKSRPRGTTITIEGLFAGITVRKLDWFKRKAQIFNQAVFLAQSYAVMSSGVRTSFSHITENGNKSQVFFCRGVDAKSNYMDCFGSSKEQLSGVFSSEFSIADCDECHLDGLFVSNNKDKAKSRLVIFINQKPFESPKWQRTVQQMLKKNYASGVEFFLKIKVPLLWLDFNVSPDKRTIYLLHEQRIIEAVLGECERVLQSSVISTTQTVQAASAPSTTVKAHASCTPEECCYEACLLSIGSAESVQLSKQDISLLVPLGQFNNGFIICSKVDGLSTELYAVDQHAADERIRYEEISKKYSISSQSLFVPVKLKLAPEQEEIVIANSVRIAEAGFKVRRLEGDDYFVLDAIPSFHGIECDVKDFYDLLDHLKDHGLLYRNLCPKFQRVLASKACRSAIMIGSPMTRQQMQTILDKLADTDYPWICAHGRPTVQYLKRLDDTTNAE